MVTDKNGKELKKGDEVMIRGKVVDVTVDDPKGENSILQIAWTSQEVPLLDFVHAKKIEKVPDSKTTE